jgi:hypothetical protein
VPRRTWLDSKIDVFLEELAASGMHLDRHRAGELITGQVRAVATLMRVTGATARSYLGDEIIKNMARRMLFEFAGERPGADLMEAPRTVPLSLALVGITVAALAEAMQVRAANEPSDHLGDVITTYAQTLSGLGQITAGAAPEQAGNPAEILFPRCHLAVRAAPWSDSVSGPGPMQCRTWSVTAWGISFREQNRAIFWKHFRSISSASSDSGVSVRSRAQAASSSVGGKEHAQHPRCGQPPELRIGGALGRRQPGGPLQPRRTRTQAQ